MRSRYEIENEFNNIVGLVNRERRREMELILEVILDIRTFVYEMYKPSCKSQGEAQVDFLSSKQMSFSFCDGMENTSKK